MMTRRLEELKTEYKNIKAPERLKVRISRIIKIRFIMKKVIKSAACAAVFLGVFIGALNGIPAFAKSMASISGMEPVVKILTFGRYQINDGNFSADVVTPKIEGLLDKELQDRINNDFKENANLIISEFEKDYKEIKKADPEAHMGIEYNYQILTDNDNILAIDVYLLNTVGSSSTIHKFYTINKKNGELLTLPSLFKENADYVNVLSQYILSEMKRQNEAGENMFWLEEDSFAEPFTQIKPDQNFYIDNRGDLVICFDKYEVAPGASGSPEFIIPKDIISNILE
ncbi:anti-sigma-V factor RsiV [Oxobacter pfennigii]|uniref:Anti-sigma-V factor RsiV n=1 Tax=Oxobacter pfennigii TaxID=36849 RepID=A0A0P8X0K4_9CLOT|nr:DUF3298 and DUF4163 domain-containing protein [Oxobacter pfennigii]KPU44292.1 anti-sigma-V factor RsiV [Oxobacter pfennigii]